MSNKHCHVFHFNNKIIVFNMKGVNPSIFCFCLPSKDQTAVHISGLFLSLLDLMNAAAVFCLFLFILLCFPTSSMQTILGCSCLLGWLQITVKNMESILFVL